MKVCLGTRGFLFTTTLELKWKTLPRANKSSRLQCFLGDKSKGIQGKHYRMNAPGRFDQTDPRIKPNDICINENCSAR